MTRVHVNRSGVAKLLGRAPLGPLHQIHSPTSFWNRKLADNAPIVNPATNDYAAKLGRQIKYHEGSTPVASYYPIGYHTTIQGSAFLNGYVDGARESSAPKSDVDDEQRRGPAS
jgi:hypothetical protein